MVSETRKDRKTGRRTRAFVCVMSFLVFPLGTVGGVALAATVDRAIDDPDAPPRVVETSPETGATDVDPATAELRLVFSQDMTGGMSWTGGGDVFPEITGRPRWEEQRTCIAPVKLQAGRFYRLGVNASSFQNFKGVNGRPSHFSVLYFVTEGASAEEKAKATAPAVVEMSPANGAEDVDGVAVTELLVTFDRKMGGGMSWTKAGGLFPDSRGRAQWNEEMTVCTMLVNLDPGTEYTLGINHHYANNFQSEWGVPVETMVWRFTTKAD